MTEAELAELERLLSDLSRRSDCQTWAWYSYGEKCYAFGVVQAVPLNDDDDTPITGRLDPHPDKERVYLDSTGRECIILESVFDAEHQSGGIECKVAVALRNAAPALLSLARRAVKLEWALRIAEQYVRSRHNEGNPSCCTCDSKSPRGVCKDLVQIREALAPEDR